MVLLPAQKLWCSAVSLSFRYYAIRQMLFSIILLFPILSALVMPFDLFRTTQHQQQSSVSFRTKIIYPQCAYVPTIKHTWIPCKNKNNKYSVRRLILTSRNSVSSDKIDIVVDYPSINRNTSITQQQQQQQYETGQSNVAEFAVVLPSLCVEVTAAETTAVNYGTLNDMAIVSPRSDKQESRKGIINTLVLLTDDDQDNITSRTHSNVNNKKYQMLGLLWTIAMLSALDRVAMSVALVPMSTEFDFTDTMKGSISSLFSVGYGISIIPAGLIVATISPKLALAIGIFIWSLATIATPIASDTSFYYTGGDDSAIALMMVLLVPILLARALVGAGESFVLPTAQRLLTVWTTPEQKGSAIAFLISGFQVGTIIAYVLSPILIDTFGGWRSLFWIYGGTGVFLLLPWLLYAQDSPSSSLINRRNITQTEKEKGVIFLSTSTTGKTKSTPQQQQQSSTTWTESVHPFNDDVPWNTFVSSKGVWAMIIAHCARNWGLYNTLSWLPTFYYEQYGIGVRESSILSVLPSVAGVICGAVAGLSSDYIVRRYAVNDKVVEDGGMIGDHHQQQQNEQQLITMQSAVDICDSRSDMDDNDDKRITIVRKGYQCISFVGSAIALFVLAWNIPNDASTAQVFITISLGLLSFSAAGFDLATQDKAGEKWAGLLYSVTTLPAVMFGTFGVWITGRILDVTNQNWSFVFYVTAGMYIVGALAFVLLYCSKKEFQ